MINVPIDSVGQMTVTVRATGMRVWTMRLRLMMLCFQLAAWIAPKNIRVDIET